MQSLFTISLLLSSAVAVPMNAGKDYAVPSEHSHYAEKRQIIPPAVNQVNNFVNEAIAEALTADVTSATALALPTPDEFIPLGSGNEKRQTEAVTGLLGGLLGGVGKRDLEKLYAEHLDKRQFDGIKSLVETLNSMEVNKRQLEPVTGLLAGLKPEDLVKRQTEAVTGLLGGLLGGVGKRDLENLKPEHLNKRQLGTVTGLLGLKPEQMNKRQLEAVTGLLGPLLGGLGGVAPPPPVAPLPVGTETTTTADPTTTYAIPTVTNLEEFPTFE
ncbi:hypothetical protein NW768_011710 [Fusarium equiseti]|uniref:Uncharacterized protein n=1 Tax=Fusarium equiseti TaxID=61235 RepID=A0ABQ8QW79_FUSEQ|nr:hypothetical protein NW768_011710 [Fusarium equiseti]